MAVINANEQPMSESAFVALQESWCLGWERRFRECVDRFVRSHATNKIMLDMARDQAAGYEQLRQFLPERRKLLVDTMQEIKRLLGALPAEHREAFEFGLENVLDPIMTAYLAAIRECPKR